MCQGKRYFFTGIVFLVIMLMLTGRVEQVQAQQKYPTKAIEFIVPWTAGGASDLSTRLMADYVSKKWGVPVNVVNKPGGNSVPACLEVYRATPDGLTLLADSGSSSSTIIAVMKDPPFKIMDRTFIGNIAANPVICIVPADSPFKSLRDVEAEAKKDPGNFTWTSLGGASGYDYAMKKFMKAIGVDIMKTRPVMAKGGSAAVALVAAGAAKVGFGAPSGAGPSIDAKMIRPLALTSNKRLLRFPDVPTTPELGYPTVLYQDRFGISGPPNLPSNIVEVWNKAMEEMLKDPEVLSRMERIGLLPFYLNSRDTRELVLKEMEEVKELWGLK